MLQRHSQGLTDDREEGPPRRPLLAPWLRRATAPDGAPLLEYADEIVAVEGFRGLDSEAVFALEPEGAIVDGPPVGDEEALREAAAGRIAPDIAAHRLARARVDLAGSGALAEEAARLLPGRIRRLGWDDTPTGDFAVAAPAAVELPELSRWNERCLEANTTWLLILPYNGRFAAVGPVFVPDETCCYRCLQLRRASALPDPDDFLALERVPAPYPLGRSLAAALAGLASSVAARWIARRDEWVTGTFFALELERGLQITRHRVLRVPRCDACSPLQLEPSPVPWASGLHR